MQARHDIDILIEADVSVICKTANVEYIWTVKEGNGRHITLDSINVLNHRQLVIPKYFLKTGTYTVYLKVSREIFFLSFLLTPESLHNFNKTF